MYEIIAATPWLAITLTGVFSLLVGSFLNVVIYRLPLMMEREWQQMTEEAAASAETDATLPQAVITETSLETCIETSLSTDDPSEASLLKEQPLENDNDKVFNLSHPASTCPHCGHLIRWYENIPLISYFLILRGRCSRCKTRISIRYPLIELITAAISAFIVYQFGFNTLALAIIFFSWCLITLTAIDLDHQLLPDKITLPLLWLGLIVNSFGYFTSLPLALWGAVLGYLSLWSVYWIFKLVTGKEGMGYGDFKLLAALGAWAGADMLPLIILASSLIGAVTGGLMILFRRHGSQTPMPFGPYLAGAGWVALLWGDSLTGWYLQLLSL
ncbi:A24 family peptidase [Amphritea sp. 2_MG-2023]|uniref:prepilin peptidase n=1 Tax=Amphritea TaxID=515417 RepID=UPI001C07DE8E|nr:MULTISPECIES: A24 family peptidase [Amphritea]MBU2965177.1 A24 family peptidase [Amphritea atlantica]MDO6419754.1 A24 family peptidase [Amphritea sp. 2_MG-2023]